MAVWVNLPYSKEQSLMKETLNGYTIVDDADYYDDLAVRNNVIVRIDVFGSLKQIFAEESIDRVRKTLFNTMSGLIEDKGVVSNVFQALYMSDNTFKRFLGEIYYFELEDGVSMYDAVVQKVKKAYDDAFSRAYGNMSARRIKVLFESDGYIYFAVSDVDEPKYVPKGYKMEVVSRAKVWKGNVLSD